MVAVASFFLVIVVFVLVTAVFWKQKKHRDPAVPGPRPKTQKNGNFPDMVAAGSLHAYLKQLHDRYGQIVSFWWGRKQVVSISSASLFREQVKLFDRPEFLFQFFSPLLTDYSIQFTNGEEGRRRRFRYDLDFSHDACERYVDRLVQISNKVSSELEKECVAVGKPMKTSERMLQFAIRSIVTCCYGSAEEEEIADLVAVYDEAIEEAARSWGGSGAARSSPDAEYGRVGAEKVLQMRSIIGNIVRRRVGVHTTVGAHRPGTISDDEYLFLDRVIDVVSENSDLADVKDEVILGDAVTFFIGGFHTTAFTLTWCLYYLAKNEDVQAKVFAEIVSTLGPDPDAVALTPDKIGHLAYCKAVLDESLRCGKVGIIAARYDTKECFLGGYKLPPRTPVIHELAVSFDDHEYFPEPEKFNPDRFSPEACKARPSLAFVPFGFAGKRKCPGYRFAYVESLALLSVICRTFELSLADPQHEARHAFGISTKPQEEVLILLSPRRQN